MNYTIAIFPEFEGKDIVEKIREKYDPSFDFLDSHIALVYYFKEKPSQDKIYEIVKGFSPFIITIESLTATPTGNYIFLDVVEGKEKIVELKNTLYTGLGLTWDKEFPYTPHITLANCASKDEQQTLLNELQKEKLSFSCKVDSFELLTVSEDLSKVLARQKFKLS